MSKNIVRDILKAIDKEPGLVVSYDIDGEYLMRCDKIEEIIRRVAKQQKEQAHYNIKSDFKIGQKVYVKGSEGFLYEGFIAGVDFHKTLKMKRLEKRYWVQGILSNYCPKYFYVPLSSRQIWLDLEKAKKETGRELIIVPVMTKEYLQQMIYRNDYVSKKEGNIEISWKLNETWEIEGDELVSSWGVRHKIKDLYRGDR